jgi:hypothetical protein
MSAGKKTVADAHARMDTHEAECAIRYTNLDEKLDDVKDGQKWAIRLSVITLLGVAAKSLFGG